MASPIEQRAPEPPRTFDDFEVIRPLGRGGMGQVYLGHDIALDRPVALKFIAAAAPSSEARSRFLVEARALARLAHPNIVGVYRIGEAAGQPYIAYEFIAGQSLDGHAMPLAWPEVLRIALGLARGLAAAHRVGILHRDIKPGNVMLSEAGEVKLLDFGLAKLGAEMGWALLPSQPRIHESPSSARGSAHLAGEDVTISQVAGQTGASSRHEGLTMPGTVLGTPLYFSPEQWYGEAATSRSDVYAMGLVLFELLTGILPFRGLEHAALLRVVLSEGLPPVCSLRPEVPEVLARIVDRCVLRHAAGRFATALEVREALEEAQHALLPAITGGHLSNSLPRTQYTRSNGLSLAYQVVGEGPVDLVFMHGWVTHVELAWQHPSMAGFLQRLASFARVVHFDKRGTGLSDRTTEAVTFEERMDDLRAVMDAVSDRPAVLLGVSDAAAMCALFAALYPRRVRALVLFGGTPCTLEAPGYPHGLPPAVLEGAIEEIHRRWGEPVFIEHEAPSVADDAGFRDWFARYLRMSASPGNAATMLRMNSAVDMRAMLPCIHVPTLVLHRTGDRLTPVGGARYMAEHIPEARLVELPGDDHLPFVGDTGAIINEVERFVDSTREVPEVSRALGILLAAQVMGESTDGRLLEIAGEPLARFEGERLSIQGRGLVFRFNGAGRALQAASELVVRAAAMGVQAHLGLHAGDCALEGDVSAEPSVLLAMRVATSAAPGELRVSEPVRMLLRGTVYTFVPYDGLPLGTGEVSVYGVRPPAGR